ncbi:MAG: DMT family transporter [Gammaproteobacteria bacterium]|nr:MAG: DMT family transporter [Gammaproteobacteria bacterium]
MRRLQSSKPLSSLLLLILLGFIWGTGYSIARFAMTHGVPPLGYSFWQSLGPAIIIGLLFSCQGKTLPRAPSHLRYYFICGLTGIAIPNTSMYFAASHLPADILPMIVNTVPIIAYPLALFVGLESFNWQRMLGVGLAFCGLMFIILPKTSLPSPDMIPWALSTLLTPISFAVCSIYIARCRPANSDIFSLTTGMLTASSLLLIPLVFSTGSFYPLHFPLDMPEGVIILEIVLSSIGYLLLFQLIKIAGPVYYSLVDTIVVITGIFWGFVIFHEKLNEWTATAVCCIVCALFLVTRQQRAIAAKQLAMQTG